MNYLRDYRIKKLMMQKELAAASGVSQVTISFIENHLSEPMELTKGKLARALGVPIKKLFPVKDRPRGKLMAIRKQVEGWLAETTKKVDHYAGKTAEDKGYALAKLEFEAKEEAYQRVLDLIDGKEVIENNAL